MPIFITNGPFVIKVVPSFYNRAPSFQETRSLHTLHEAVGLTDPPVKNLNQLHLSRPALNRDFIYLKSRY